MKGNPLAGYGRGIRKETLLGWVAWYGISEPQIRYDDLRKKVEELGLDKEIVPPAVRPGDAFKRACRYAEQSKLVIPGTETYANIMIRKVAQNPEVIERHIVLEVVDASGRRLEHHDAVALVFTKMQYTLRYVERGKTKTEDFNAKADAQQALEDTGDPEAKLITTDNPTLSVLRLYSGSRAINAILDAGIERFRSEFESASLYIDSQTLRGVIRKQLDRLRSFPLKSSGAVYFIPKNEEAKAVALAELHAWFGNGSSFHILPLIDTEKQREMIQGAFEDEVHEEAKQMVFELRQSIDNKTPMTAGKYLALRERKEALQHRAAEFSDLIDHEFVKAGTELAVLDDFMTTAFMEGLVKS